ncbi:hypothetical protein D3C84_550580 [compost metagenome]
MFTALLTWVTELPVPMFFAACAPRSSVKPFCCPMLKLAPIAVLLLFVLLAQSAVFCALSSVISFFAIKEVSVAFKALPMT